MEEILIGVVDRSILVFIPDPASTDGSGKTGLVAANLTVSYTRVETDNDVTVTDVTSSLNNLSALTDAHNDWGLLEVSSTLAPGLYRLDVADAVFATGAWYAVVYVEITSSAAAATPKAFALVSVNKLDGVRMGLTALPNAAAEAAGGLYTRGTGAGQINQPANGMVDVNAVRHLGTAYATPTVAGVPEVDITHVGGVAASVAGAVDANVTQWNGSAVATPTVAGVPEVDVTHYLGSASPALVGGRFDASVGAMAANVITAAAAAADFSSEIADQVWDEAIAGHVGAGSTGAALSAAGGAGDPWTTTLPGSYIAGQAGHTIGTYIDAAISSRLAPTVAARTLDVSAGGEAGIDWANIGSPTTAQNLSATNIDVDQVVASVSGAVGSVTGSVGSVVGAVGSVAGAVGSVTGNVGGNVVGSVGSVTGNVGGNVTGSVGSVTGLTASDVAAIKANTDLVTAARMGALTDWIDGGRLDLILDQIAADLPSRITKNTALSNFPFKMVDATDHVTAETGLTITATRSIDGAAFAACANAATEVSGGWYKIDLAAADLNGNTIVLRFAAAGADTREVAIVTQP